MALNLPIIMNFPLFCDAGNIAARYFRNHDTIILLRACRAAGAHISNVMFKAD